MSTAKNEGLRVVLDSNVYVSAFTHPQGQRYQIWRRAFHKRYHLVASPAIVNEVGGVLRVKFGWDDLRIIGRMKLLTRVAEIVVPTSTVNAIADDEDDNRILECAVAGKANLIVSSDRHLTRLKTFQSIGIVHPVDFRRTLGD